MKKSPEPDTEDALLFRQAMDGVRPLQKPRQRMTGKKPPAKIPSPSRTSTQHSNRMPDSAVPDGDFDAHESLYTRPGIQKTLLRRLRKGSLDIESEIDLHGLRVPAAVDRLAQFIADERSRGKRVLRVIHGKGLRSPDKQARLKYHCRRLLRELDAVLAYSDALPPDGGSGALYVLLKR